MALHGLGSMTLGVPHVDDARAVLPRVRVDRDGAGYVRHPRRRGATPRRRATGSTAGRGDAWRPTIPTTSPASPVPPPRHDLDVTNHDDGSISVLEPVVGIRVRAAVRDRIAQAAVRHPTDERSGQHRARRRSGAGDLRRGHGRAAPARSRAVGHARHRRQQALPRRRARFPVDATSRPASSPSCAARPIITTSG